MVLRLIYISLVGCFISCGSPEAKTTHLAKTGVQLYKTYCQSCHGEKGDAKRGGAANLITSRLSEQEIRKIILYGNDNGMMAYKDLLQNKQELDSLVSLVKELRTK